MRNGLARAGPRSSLGKCKARGLLKRLPLLSPHMYHIQAHQHSFLGGFLEHLRSSQTVFLLVSRQNQLETGTCTPKLPIKRRYYPKQRLAPKKEETKPAFSPQKTALWSRPPEAGAVPGARRCSWWATGSSCGAAPTPLARRIFGGPMRAEGEKGKDPMNLWCWSFFWLFPSFPTEMKWVLALPSF